MIEPVSFHSATMVHLNKCPLYDHCEIKETYKHSQITWQLQHDCMNSITHVIIFSKLKPVENVYQLREALQGFVVFKVTEKEIQEAFSE